MAWTTPKTWSSEPLTSNDLNTYNRDNQNHLYNRVDNIGQVTLTSDVTTTSTSFVDVTGLEVTLTIEHDTVIVGFAGTVQNDGNGDKGPYFEVTVDGTAHFGSDGVVITENPTGLNGQYMNGSFVAVITGLTAGSRTFKLQWKTAASTTSTMKGDPRAQFWVAEK